MQFAYPVLFKPAGFRIEKIKWVEGYFGTVAHQLEAVAKYLPIKSSDVSPGLAGFAASPVPLSPRSYSCFWPFFFTAMTISVRLKGDGFPNYYAVSVTRVVTPEH